MPRYTTETSVRIYNDESGDYIYVGPDSDGLDLVSIYWSDGKTGELPVTMEKERAVLLAKAILNLYGWEE